MARLGLVGRMMLIVLCVSFAMFCVVIGVEGLQREREGQATSRPMLLNQVAAAVRLLDHTPPDERRLVVRALTSEVLQLDVAPEQASEPQSASRATLLEGLLQNDLKDELAGRVRATYSTGSADLHLSRGIMPDRSLRITIPLRAGGVAIFTTTGPLDVLSRRLYGLPPGFWVGIIGFAVAMLALLAAWHEARPLERLAQSVSRFDGILREPVPESGAPDIRALIHAVNTMQMRIVTLLRERSLLIGSISHDLKTFLTRLRLRAETMENEDQRLRAIRDLDDMTALLETALAFARGTTVSEKRKPVDLADLLATEIAEQEARGARIGFRDEPTASAVVDGDPVALRRVFANVIDNALHYGRRTEIGLVSQKDRCRVTVDDDGPGIPETERAAVFGPFYRLDNSRSRNTGGTGLGLAIAKQIVEAHRGRVEALSSPLGGARVVVELPLSG